MVVNILLHLDKVEIYVYGITNLMLIVINDIYIFIILRHFNPYDQEEKVKFIGKIKNAHEG
jgi:hypothetical protein